LGKPKYYSTPTDCSINDAIMRDHMYSVPFRYHQTDQQVDSQGGVFNRIGKSFQPSIDSV